MLSIIGYYRKIFVIYPGGLLLIFLKHSRIDVSEFFFFGFFISVI